MDGLSTGLLSEDDSQHHGLMDAHTISGRHFWTRLSLGLRIGAKGTDLVTSSLQSGNLPLMAGWEAGHKGESTLKTQRNHHRAAVGKVSKTGVSHGGRKREASPLRVGLSERHSSKY